MKKVSEEDKIRINELYLKYKTYTEVSRQTGFSPGTVKKYIIPDFKSYSEVPIKTFKVEDIPEEIDIRSFLEIENIGDLCILSEEEETEIKEFWDELKI